MSEFGGQGVLPPLGDKGDPKDVTRHFPRPCDTCNCFRFVYVEKEIREEGDEGILQSSQYLQDRRMLPSR